MAVGMTCGMQYPVVVRFTQNPAGTGVTSNYTMVRAGKVTDAWCVSLAAAAGGTCLVSKAGAAVTSAMVCATAAPSTIGRTTLIDDANSTFATGDVMRFVSGGAATVQPDVFVLLIPTVSYSTTV